MMTAREALAVRYLEELYSLPGENLTARAITLLIEGAIDRIRPGTCPDYPEDDIWDQKLGFSRRKPE